MDDIGAQKLAERIGQSAHQPELFPRVAPVTILEAIRNGLGGKLWQTPPEVATACGVSVNIVYGWIDAGLIQHVNIGPRSKPVYRVFSPSVLKFYESRVENP